MQPLGTQLGGRAARVSASREWFDSTSTFYHAHLSVSDNILILRDRSVIQLFILMNKFVSR